ncbi:MAG: ribonuclease Y [Clostridia bacterium]|nr:ribonuclease Y [Clostridia bacterium]MDY6184264.1 ribonuclease Y [Eubacteriales bacterium]
MEWYFVLLIGLAAALVGVLAGYLWRRKISEAKIGSAEKQAMQIVNDAMKQAETKKKESLLEAKEEIIRQKNEADAEIKDRRREVTHQEHRIAQKEEAIDRKVEAIEKKETALAAKIAEADALKQKVEAQLEEQRVALERVAGLTAEEAKNELLARKSEEIAHETAKKISEFESQYKEEVDEKAKELLSLAIQKCAADHVSESAISVVELPSEDMKGRIIGREGRNIRTIETLTGVELIIDDTPEVITISGFDPVRREIARLALEKLISDGRIHPTRIEEMVEKARREVETSMRQAGEKAVFETGVSGLHVELVKLLGRLKYRTSYGQNVLRHSIEVALLAGVLADEMGLDSSVAKRAGLLHDIGKAMTAEIEGSHVAIGVDIAKRYRESKEIINAIEAHHGDVEPLSPIAVLVQAADAISAARPGARRENVENYIKRLQRLEEIAGDFKGVDTCYAIQAGREVRVMVKPDEVTDDQMVIMAHDIAKKIEEDLEYPGQIKVHIIREKRVADYAK